MTNDFFLIFHWWFLLFGLGIIFFPLTWWFFKNFFDLGYGFSKIIAVLMVSYLTWLFGSLKILPFSFPSVLLIIIVLLFPNLLITKIFKKEFSQKIKNQWQIIVLEEIIFLLTLNFWSCIRGFQPNIEGLEKFMDFGFVNSILRSKYFPPQDMWFAGESINYYYFGHLVSAVLTKLSTIDSAITYNLLIASLFALSFSASFSIGANLIFLNSKKENRKLFLIIGLLTALILTLGGNLHPLWYLINHGNYKGYWYPDATRFIVEKFGAADNTIHEFPIYSFVVADLHGHLLNLPNVLLFLGLILATISKNSKKFFWPSSLFFSLLLAIFYMTNAWDFAIYTLLFSLLILVFNYLKNRFSLKTIIKTISLVFPVFAGSLILALPFHLNFKNLTQGIKLTDFHSPFWMLLILWGFPLFLTLSFLVYLIKVAKEKEDFQKTEIFIATTFVLSWFLILFPEVFYFKDIYIHSYQRANTMFKFTYQAFVMFYLNAFYVIYKILKKIKNKALKIFYSFVILFFLFFILGIYPRFAILSYYEGLRKYQGLNGISFLKNSSSDDYQAILWLRKNINGQPKVLEAAGDSYTLFNRVSSLTGLPTIQGWLVHEWLWRGGFEEPGKRASEVQTIYETNDKNQTLALLKKYNVSYIFIGSKEREKYKISEEKFSKIGKIIFKSGKTKIYKIEETNF